MGMFGNAPQTRGANAATPFKLDEPYRTPPYVPSQTPQPGPAQSGGSSFGDIVKTLLGGAADGVAQYYGGQPGFALARERSRKIAEDQQRLAQAEAQRQRERRENFADWKRQADYTRDHAAPKVKEPYRFEDNAGNVWERDPDTGENKRIFTDIAPKTYLQDGQVINVPNPFAKGADMGADLPAGWSADAPAQPTPDPGQAAHIKQQLIERFGPGPRAESEFQKWLQSFGGGR